MRDWLESHGDVLALGALAAAPLAVFARAAFMRGVFYIHDVQYYFYPYHLVPAKLLRNGELPLWNPYAFSGIPLLGDGQTAMFYPPNWLFFFLPSGVALNYDVLLQFSIAGIGSYLLARSLGLYRAPALVSALAFMFCGFLTARVVHLSILSGGALVPLVFLCVDRALRRPSSARFVAASLAVCLQAIAGHPQVPVYTALALALYAAFYAVEECSITGSSRPLHRAPLRLASIYLFGYCLAAIQLVPWIELARLSPRAAGASFEFVFGGSMRARQWLLFLFPYMDGSLLSGIHGERALNIAESVALWEHSAYVGILPLSLAAYALLGLGELPRWESLRDASAIVNGVEATAPLGHGNPRRWFMLAFLLALVGLGALMAAGDRTPVAALIYATPVVGKLRDVERALVLSAFALSVLAGLGLQRLIEPPRGSYVDRGALFVVFISTLLLPLGIIVLAGQPWFAQSLELTPTELANLQLSRMNAAIPVAFALAGAALFAARLGRHAGTSLQVAAVVLVLLDMGSYARAFNPITDRRLFEQEPEVLTAFRGQTAPYRKATLLWTNDIENRAARELLAVSWGLAYGIEDINGFNSLQPRRYTDFLFDPSIGDVSYGSLTDLNLLRPENPILSMLNVRYVILPPYLHHLQLAPSFRQVYRSADALVYENVAALPRAYFAKSVRVAKDPTTVLRTVKALGFDPKHALIEADEEIPPASGPAHVRITNRRANAIRLATETRERRLLVLSEMHFSGWRATVDGVETAIHRTNYLFRGIVVPPGKHTVNLEYRPASGAIGAAISGFALLFALLLGWPKLLRAAPSAWRAQARTPRRGSTPPPP